MQVCRGRASRGKHAAVTLSGVCSLCLLQGITYRDHIVPERFSQTTLHGMACRFASTAAIVGGEQLGPVLLRCHQVPAVRYLRWLHPDHHAHQLAALQARGLDHRSRRRLARCVQGCRTPRPWESRALRIQGPEGSGPWWARIPGAVMRCWASWAAAPLLEAWGPSYDATCPAID